jgi:hypothetical protein
MIPPCSPMSPAYARAHNGSGIHSISPIATERNNIEAASKNRSNPMSVKKPASTPLPVPTNACIPSKSKASSRATSWVASSETW